MMHMCKTIISPGVFFIFRLSGWWKGKKWFNMTKDFVSQLVFQESCIVLFSFMVCMCKGKISSGIFVIFFKILIFGIIRWIKGQKMTKNDKNFCQSHSVSQEPYIIFIWLWFWYTWIKWCLQQFFSFFQNFDFLGF